MARSPRFGNASTARRRAGTRTRRSRSRARSRAPRTKGRDARKRGCAPIALAVVLVVAAIAFAPKAISHFAGSSSGSPDASAPATAQETSDSSSQTSEIAFLSNRYYLNKLDAEEKKAAEAIYKGVSNFEKSASVSLDLSKEQLEDVLAIVHSECPELMQYETISCVTTPDGTITELTFSYTMGKSEYDKKRAAVEQVIDDYKAQTKSLSQDETILFVYDAIAASTTYSTTASDCGNAYGALVGKQAKCDGFSAALQWTLNSMGINCSTVTGASRDDGVGHAWNMWERNGSWHFTDLTSDAQNGTDVAGPMHAAYGVSRSWMENAYRIDDAFSSSIACPVSSSDMSSSYHVMQGTYVDSLTDCADVLEAAFETNADGSMQATIQFSELKDLASARNDMTSLVQTAIGNSSKGFGLHLSTLEQYRTISVKVDFATG